MSYYPIKESGMEFNAAHDDSFYIEKSDLYNSFIPLGVKTVEFLWLKNSEILLFIEAKSSFSNPNKVNDFNKNIEDICEKFTHSIDLFFAVLLKRLEDKVNEIPLAIKRN